MRVLPSMILHHASSDVYTGIADIGYADTPISSVTSMNLHPRQRYRLAQHALVRVIGIHYTRQCTDHSLSGGGVRTPFVQGADVALPVPLLRQVVAPAVCGPGTPTSP
jgi:hypothetical protein